MEPLSEHAKQLFAERLSQYGTKLEDLKDNINTAEVAAKKNAAAGTEVTTGHPEGGADLPGKVRDVKDIDEMKKYGGVPDSDFKERGLSDAHVHYPDAPKAEDLAAVENAKGDVCHLMDNLSAHAHQNLRKASQAYVLGHSEKVKAWKPILDMADFPAQGTVVDHGDVVVDPGHPLKIVGPGPVTYNAKSITVKPGGQIITETDVTFNVGSMIVE